LLKLIKYLRPFTWSIILIFGLLLGQALSDLTLPDLMSKIINVGIQQNGIVNTAPIAIRSSEMNKIFLFAGDADKDIIANNYILLDSQKLSPSDYSNYLKTYPELANVPIYKLNTTNKTEISKLNSIFNNPILIVSYIESGAVSSLFGNNVSFPAGIDPFVVLA